jgi:hypothetical protein
MALISIATQYHEQRPGSVIVVRERSTPPSSMVSIERSGVQIYNGGGMRAAGDNA